MARHQGPVLVDTNVIIECHRTRLWNVLSGAYRIETVEDCVIETQTGFRRRQHAQLIDETYLRRRLHAVHLVDARSSAEVMAAQRNPRLDLGEAALWAHALHRTDNWVLCGPDYASIQYGFENGFRDSLISLEALLDEAGHRRKVALQSHYTKNWLNNLISNLILNANRSST